MQASVDEAFEQVVPIQHFLAEYNDYIAEYMPRNAEAGYPWAVAYVASRQPAVTEQEFRAALEMAVTTGLEERGLMQVDGVLRPRPLDRVTIAMLRRVLETGHVPRRQQIETWVTTSCPGSKTYMFLPTMRVTGNEIVIRQVYLATEYPPEGERFDRSGSMLPGYAHRLR